MKPSSDAHFKSQYERHCKHLALKGMRPKTVDAYSRAIRRIGAYFDYQLDELSQEQLLDYFTELLDSHSWSTVKLDLYGLKFFYRYVLGKPWTEIDLIQPPEGQRLPDIVTVVEARRLFRSTRVLSYRVFYFTLYSLGLRLGEGLRLEVGDIDAARQRVHIRNAKGQKDRLVPLPQAALIVLRRFWQVHRNPRLLFPSRLGGRDAAQQATTVLDRGSVQTAMRKVVRQCGLKKRSRRTAYATAMPPIYSKRAWTCSRCNGFSAIAVS